MSAQIILTKRDMAIIVMVYLFGGCSSAHVAKRIFPTLKSPRVSYRSIARLTHAGYLDSRRLPSSTGVGSGRLFLSVGPKGRAVVAQALGVSASDLARSRIDAPRFIDHHLAICDTRVNVELAVERSNLFTLIEWSRDRQVEV
ncbi:replication-relaxation family protein [Candidatus Daviesbacteria bacterium]|nr:replication-relaxation family protein [Candidatus Daviesbacteria bacterium]